MGSSRRHRAARARISDRLPILALDGAIANWLAALIVGLVYAAIAGVLYLRGKHRVEEAGSPVPEKTIETVKEDVQWAKHPTTSAKT